MRKIFMTFCLVGYVFQATSATYRALVFGLGAQEDTTWGKIRGDNDLYYVRQLLDDAGFTDIVQIKNEKATKQEIERQRYIKTEGYMRTHPQLTIDK